MNNGVHDDTGTVNDVGSWITNGINGSVDAKKMKRATSEIMPDHAKETKIPDGHESKRSDKSDLRDDFCETAYLVSIGPARSSEPVRRL